MKNRTKFSFVGIALIYLGTEGGGTGLAVGYSF
jgi:hypothetical protein